MAYLNGRAYTDFRGINLSAGNGAMRFTTPSVTPTTTSGERLLYVNSSNQLIYDNGSTTTNLGASGSSGGSLDTAYDNGAVITVDVNTVTLTQTLNDTGFLINKTGTGAGLPARIVNAGTGEDLQIETTRASSTGVVLDFYHNSASPADADVIFEAQFNGEDDGGNTTEYARLRALSADVTDTTEDGTVQLAMMVGGTVRTCLDVTGSLFTIGDGNSNATLDTSGAFDLILRTNAGTNSGTITIFDGANGNIELLNNGSGDVTIPTSGIVQGGTTGTRCSFTTAGTTGDSFVISNSTITSGDVLAVDHTASATLSGGNLLNLLVDSTSVFAVAENGLTTIAGTGGSNAIDITPPHVRLSDGSLSLTDADNANTLSVINNTATTVSVISLDGSGTFTGNTTAAFMTLNPSGLTTGTALYILTDAATTLSKAVDISSSHTTGKGMTITCTGVMTGVGKALEIIADSATTAGASAGEGIISVSADALTTGVCLRVESLSNEVFTSGALGKFDHSASGTTVAAVSTAGLLQATSSITESGTSTQAFDVVNFTRTSIHDTAGTLTASGSVLKLDRVSTQTDATLTDTVVVLEVNAGVTSTGDGIFLNNDAIAGIALNIDAENTTGDIVNFQCAPLTTGFVIDVSDADGLTTGSILNLVSNSSDTGTRNLVFVHNNHASANDAVVMSLRQDSTDHTLFLDHDGATGSALAIRAETTSGVSVDISSAVLDTGKVIDISDLAAITTGKVIHIDATGITHTDAILVHIDSAGTVITSTGRLFLSDHTGVTTTSGVLNEFKSAANDETVMVRVNATSTLTGGIMLDITGASVTTGTLLDISDADALTTGIIANFASNSADTGTKALLRVTNDNTAATGTTPIRIQQDAPTSTNYWRVTQFVTTSGTVTLWVGSGATGNGNLSGTAGDILFNGGSNKPEYCTGTTNWTALV